MQLTGETKTKFWILATICIITFLCFIHNLHNQFTNWDDDYYIALDPYIKAFSWYNLKIIFTKNITLNYYHPFTMLSLAFNYHFSQMNPTAYYLTNMLIHIANVIVVFILANSLFSKLEFINKKGVLFISTFSALWFGIHPMHVESVSWIAERKDVLYTFFYLVGLVSYLKYLSFPNWKWYLITLVLFISSCLSKPMAVVFPLSLFCVDFLLNRKLESSVFRKWRKGTLIEKIPFFIVALFFGIISYHFTQQSNSITSFSNIPIAKRLMFASYGFVMYISKFFAPFHLSTFYPYPCVNMELHVDMPLPLFYYFSFWIALLIVSLPLFASYRANNNYIRVVVFGLGFFLTNVIFELQFISAGMAIMADRYSYLSYVGLFFALTFFIHEIINRIPILKTVTLTMVILFTIGLAFLCYKRTEVWHNGESLFKDALEQYGDEASLFYKALGEYYQNENEPENAIVYYGKYTRLNNDAEVFNDMGNLYKSLKDYPDAAKYYSKLIIAGAPVSTTYIKISDAWATMGQNDSAVIYFRKSAALNPDVLKLYEDIGTACLNTGKYNNAINHYNVLVTVNPQNPFYYFYRGVAKFNSGDLKESLDDFQMPLKLSPNEVVPEAAYNLSVVYDKLGDDVKAYNYALIARKAGQKIDSTFFNSLELKKSKSASGK
jgi:protein O-mannosyl-transferase